MTPKDIAECVESTSLVTEMSAIGVKNSVKEMVSKVYCQTCGKEIVGKPVKKTVWDVMFNRTMIIMVCGVCKDSR